MAPVIANPEVAHVSRAHACADVTNAASVYTGTSRTDRRVASLRRRMMSFPLSGMTARKVMPSEHEKPFMDGHREPRGERGDQPAHGRGPRRADAPDPAAPDVARRAAGGYAAPGSGACGRDADSVGSSSSSGRSPFRTALTTASARVRACRRRMAMFMCARTVRMESPSSRAISLSTKPCA